MLRPAPLACTECRKHHIKCDAEKPSCSRCKDAHLACVYLPSRRGGRRKPANTHRLDHSANHPLIMAQSVFVPDSRLVLLYYTNFHSGHPILVPPTLYEGRQYPSYLQQVVKFIGSHYSLVLSNDTFYEATAVELSTSLERTPCMVQALLLYSIIMYARNQSSQADHAFSRAVDIALELGMYRKDFANTFSGSQEPEAESLRRTWWELFFTEVYMASLQQKVNLRCGNVPYDVALPCEDASYASPDSIPPPPTLAAFRMRIFMDDDQEAPLFRYSSYSYRIEAVRILARVLVLNSLPETHNDHLQALVNALVSWVNHLPRDKVDVVDKYGNVDEMLFQAHITIHYAAMLLHLPRSNLRPKFPNTELRICPGTPFRLSPSLTRHVHDVKATESSKQLSNLLFVRPNAQGYSPFIVCSLVLCGMVQLATSESHSSDCFDHHCNRVVLVLGCLKLLKKKSWSLAQEAHRYLRQAATQTITSWVDSPSSQGSNTLPTTTGPDHPGNLGFGGLSPGASANDLFSPRLLSAYIDPTCNDPFLINRVPGFDTL
ncbi:hypothetical protein P175DRAFT_0512716 [Aspergillus ochraceoroseus IBT 24754]|uniref:Zn(2)-C6 fungal-type domain-containing protein n=1 Tax=Aspergillus ochraceoroseus IBT 24754 TaxID=1392256 RepID=A0A2T5LKT7_9EURO|nr:uncharacterized protein P175DRAFT_0512716 [Aspergillus ochraceoroseus IBT 24754]PTU16890.1 hypothetical protein P175DRAFT_0512716 [Aspergillus ochraceoroseus IBT 24754]